MRIQLFELPHFASGSPTQIAVPSVAQIGVPDLLETACQVKAPGELVSERFVMDEIICLRRADRLLVEMLCLYLVVFDPCDLCAYQGRTVFKVFRAIFCPDLKLLVVLGKGIQERSPILGSSRVPGCRSGQGTVELIFCLLEK